MKDYYEILGVARDASPDEVKKAFRALARDTHPDANPGDPEAEARFRDIAEAYEVLSDPQKRARYDRGETFGGQDLFSQFGGLEDILQQFFGGGFGGFSGFGGQQRGPQRGRDIAVRLDPLVVVADGEGPHRNRVLPGFGILGGCGHRDGWQQDEQGEEVSHAPLDIPVA